MLIWFWNQSAFTWSGPVSSRTALVEPEFRNFLVV